MKKHMMVMMAALVLPFMAKAKSIFEGTYQNQEGTYQVNLTEFNSSVTMNTVSYYSNGAAVNWFFDFKLPTDHQVQVGEVVPGRVRSVDGFYGCVFDEQADMMMEKDGVVKIHLPLLTYHRETRSVRENAGSYYRRTVDWTYWGWVETAYHFPIERYRVISDECVIVQRNWVTNMLYPMTTEIPVPAAK